MYCDSFLTGMGGPGDQPGMARNAAAGPMDAGSDAVATTRTTIFSAYASRRLELGLRWWFIWGISRRRIGLSGGAAVAVAGVAAWGVGQDNTAV